MTEFSTFPPVFNELSCSIFPLCPGCIFQKNIFNPPVWKEIQEWAKSRNIPLLGLFHKDGRGWRTRAKLAVRGSSLHPQIGLFKRGTHAVVDLKECPLHHPSLNDALCLLREQIVKNRIEPYCEEKETGELRYIQMAAEGSSKRVQLTLVVHESFVSSRLKSFVKSLAQKELWHSIWINFQPKVTNRIFGEEWMLCHGERYVWESLGGNEICFHPACFSQANLSLFAEMLHSIQRRVAPGKRVIEFYAGVGVIGLSLAEKSKELVCSEITPFARECFLQSKRKLSPSVQKKVHCEIGSAQEGAPFVDAAEVILLDPPRKGVDPLLLKASVHSSCAEQCVYVSCGWNSFKRDAEAFLKEGWILELVEGYLFFPGNDHVETVGYFKRIR